MKNAITWISAAYAAVALTSFIAVRKVGGVVDGMAPQGGGIGELTAGIADATRWPIAGAWIAVVASLVALAMAFRAPSPERPARNATLAALAIAAGAVAVLAFRGLTNFIIDVAVPGSTSSTSGIAGHLTAATVATALCFAAAIAAAILALRSRAAMRVALLAVVVSLGVCAVTIVTMRDLRARYQYVAAGGLDGLDQLINRPLPGSPRSSSAGR